MSVNIINPDNTAVQQLQEHHMKLFAMLVWKLAPGGVTITVGDMEKFAAEGGVLLTQGHFDSFEFRIVTPEAAARLAAHDAATNRGTA